MTRHGIFHWNELHTRDAESARTFYKNSLGWSFDEVPSRSGSSYWICKSADQPVAGIFTMEDPAFDGVPEHWLPYILVDNVDERCRKAEANGATIRRAPFEVPGMGKIAIIAEPGGAILGWMTPA